MVESVELKLGDELLSIETGRVARQANGSVLVKCGGTVVLVTAVARKTPSDNYDYFPLTVHYIEKGYAAGKIPGGFIKREGRLSDKETITSRLVDRPIRPLFPGDFFNEVQIIAITLSTDQKNQPDVLAMVGASAALSVSDIPFDGPIGSVRVGKIDGKFVINPTFEQQEESELELLIAGNKEGVVMVEGIAKEVSEEMMVEAVEFAHKEIKNIIDIQQELVKKIAKPKMEYIPISVNEELKKKIVDEIYSKYEEITFAGSKLEKYNALDALREEIIEKYTGELGDISEQEIKYNFNCIFEEIEHKVIRDNILNNNRRADGRTSDDIRPINIEIAFLPRTHGSSVFTRGETQSLSTTTLGTIKDEQRFDNIEGEATKGFMLHYNFPPFSVGETGRIGGPGRREIGHGMLAEKALMNILPSYDDFPYTIRIVSEILESNGSSSMATVCAGCLSLMDAGVPIKNSVSGVALGLVIEGDKYVILKDIMGIEDHNGDMDFKVAGTRDGITAFQMDLKINYLSIDIFKEALQKAKEARFYILDKMDEVIAKPKDQISEFAPRILTMSIPVDKIRDVIGSGGKIIKKIIEDTEANINIDDDGTVTISGATTESAEMAVEQVKDIIEDVEVGKTYDGIVKRITDFGAFIEIKKGKEGLLHISKISKERVEKVTDYLNVDDEVEVRVIEIDKFGRINLSKKEL